ncbi:radical SAM/SPASM domain-containing protein [Methylomicrobium album]|uniref:Radical SAM additional 4Fe4S-binding domain protein n=1 Tax=Methylomicrobium album BG8 TaxID=686340 RepID=H8GHT1_METAL|nr:SPASM domain-containing protein [Methylomicrobium album]EIC31399.1 radical SAM additional 4Fe4S-binding domain protein [Methylomicrobium album BG8]
MKNLLKEFHILNTKIGPVGFHGPSAKLFELQPDIASSVSALKKGDQSFDALPCFERERLEQTLRVALSEGLGTRTNILGESESLTGFYLFVSQECNLACTYCYGDGGEYRKGKMMMDQRTADNFIDKFITDRNPGYLINFFGGEPLLNLPLMQRIIDRCKAKTEPYGIRMVFNMTTNGTVWNEKIANFVAANLDTVTVSLDGPKDINDSQRPGLGSFSPYDKTVRTIDELRQSEVRYTVRTIMTKNSFGRLKEIYRHNSALAGKGGVGLSSVDVADGHALGLTDAEHRALVDEIAEINSDNLHSLADSDHPQFNEYTGDLCQLLLGRQFRPRPCNASQTVLAIAADGDIYPCHRFVGYQAFCVGNVNDDQPLNDRHTELRQSFKAMPVDKNPQCSHCWAQHLCGGSCYVISHLREGDIFKPPARYCYLKQTVYERLLTEFAEIMADPQRKQRLIDNVTYLCH